MYVNNILVNGLISEWRGEREQNSLCHGMEDIAKIKKLDNKLNVVA